MPRRTEPVERAVRRYRALLALFPPSWRDEAADELCQVFEDELRDAHLAGRLAVAAFWMRAAVDTAISLPGAWWTCMRKDGRNHGRGAMTGWVRDVRTGARSLAKRPGFAVAVTLTLGLGIGATTTIFSVVDGVMLRPLPYDDASRLVAVGGTDPARDRADEGGLSDLAPLTMLSYRALRERSRSLEALAALDPFDVLLTDVGDGPDEVPSARVASELFDALGVSPLLGRTFLPEEHLPDAPGAMLISYGAWQRRFGGDPSVVGRQAPRFYEPTTIVGILPRDFLPPDAFFPEGEEPEFWLPLQPDHSRYESQYPVVWAIGRLSRGAGIDGARTEAAGVASALAAEFPDENLLPDGTHTGIGVNGLQAQTVGRTGGALGTFLGAALLLLVLACMNAATLFLARLMDRAGELGVGSALGAGRVQVVRLLVAEAVVIAASAGALGVAIAYGGVTLFLRFAPSSIPSLTSVSVDGRVLSVTAALSLGVGLAAGLVPAVRLLRGDPWDHMRRGARTTSDPVSRLRPLLVGGQMAVAVVLLTGASLLFTSFTRIRSADPGFEPDGLVTFGVGVEGMLRSSSPGEINSIADAWDLALERVAAVPGVEAVAAATTLPFQAPRWMPRILVEGDPPDTWREGIAGYGVTPEYFATVGIPVVSGRAFERSDGPRDELVAIVNETFVRTQLDGADPLGHVVRHADALFTTELRVVGVVADAVQGRVEDGPRPAIYVPYTQVKGAMQAVARTPLPPDVVAPDLRRAVATINPIEPLRDLTTMRDRMGATRSDPRFQAFLIAAFAIVAVLLAAAGLYSSLAHWVGRRRRELGLRMAVGADRAAVRRMVLGQGLTLAGAGLGVGLLGALVAGRTLAGFLYGVSPTDPLVLLGAAAALLCVAALASFVPARRATAVDPVTVLKSE